MFLKIRGLPLDFFRFQLIGKSDEDLVFHLCKDYQYLHLQTIIFSQCRFTSQYEVCFPLKWCSIVIFEGNDLPAV